MASIRNDCLARQMRVLFSEGVAGGLTDTELLDRFAARNGEAAELAFAALVKRHGPMVLRVCRQTLRDGHAAEDAFQAVFLVLARRARSLYPGNSLAPWLQGVAWRTATRLREQSSLREFHERRAAESASILVADRAQDDLGDVLHEEIGRLPARYRVPLVLCYLEGLTAEQAARQLGWPDGTVRSRLARGRDRLRKRLIRRGMAPSSAVVVAALSSGTARAVPATLADVTARAAAMVAAGHDAAGLVPASILSLTEGVLQMMAMTKWKMSGLALLASVVLTSGALVSAQAPGPGLNPSESDRLRAVEAKLDRLLQKLDGAGDSRGSGRGVPNRGVNDGQAAATAPAEVVRGPAGARDMPRAANIRGGAALATIIPSRGAGAEIEYELRIWRAGIPMTEPIRMISVEGETAKVEIPEGTVTVRLARRQDRAGAESGPLPKPTLGR
jgi:RNA polymerase sigma factor (sigma-70 family)